MNGNLVDSRKSEVFFYSLSVFTRRDLYQFGGLFNGKYVAGFQSENVNLPGDQKKFHA